MTMARVVALGIGLLLWTPAVGTQVVAHQLRYASWLGTPLCRLGWLGFYAPYKYVVWYWHYAWYYPVPFEWGIAAMGLWMVSGAILVAVLLKRSGWQRHSTYGEAEWATASDIRKAKLFVRIRK